MNMTRRDFLGASATVLASTAIGSPIRSSIGGRMEYHEGDTRLYDSDVEYLESTGTQYIDTGVYGGSFSRVVIVASSNNTTHYCSLFGARQGSGNRPSYSVWQRTNAAGGPKMRFDYNSRISDSVVGADVWNPNSKMVVEKNGRYNYVNGVQIVSNSDMMFSLDYPFFVFNINSNGLPTSYPFVGRIYNVDIWDEGQNLIVSLTPVRFTNENISAEGAMYDRVSGQLFRNQGTGSFIIGPDV